MIRQADCGRGRAKQRERQEREVESMIWQADCARRAKARGEKGRGADEWGRVKRASPGLPQAL